MMWSDFGQIIECVCLCVCASLGRHRLHIEEGGGGGGGYCYCLTVRIKKILSTHKNEQKESSISSQA